MPVRTLLRSGRLFSPPLRLHRYQSTTTTPPLLSVLRAELKPAMQQKDTARLSVLRAVLAAVATAASSPRPIVSDAQLRALMKRRIAKAEDARTQFVAAGRQDLAEQEEAQMGVLRRYVGHGDEGTDGTVKEGG